MTETESKPPRRYFGWIKKSAGADDDRLDALINKKELTDETWAEFQEIVGVIAELRPYLIDFTSLEQEFEIVCDLEERVRARFQGDGPSLLMRPGVPMILAYVTAQRMLSNFLGAASAFRDRAKVRLIEKHGEDSAPFLAFDAAVKRAYDSSFAYRLLYNLRNYAQHREGPIELIPVNGKRSDGGKIIIAVRIELQRDKLLSKFLKMQSRVRGELATQPPTIPLLPLAHEYMRMHWEIMLSIISAQQHRIMDFAQYANVVVTTLGVPEGATPLVWSDPTTPATDGETKFNHHGFSFDEFEYLVQLMFRYGPSQGAPNMNA